MCLSSGVSKYCECCPVIRQMREQERLLLAELRVMGNPFDYLHDGPWIGAWNEDSISRILEYSRCERVKVCPCPFLS